MVDLIEDESEKGAVVKVTLEDGVEYLNYNDVSICTIVNGWTDPGGTFFLESHRLAALSSQIVKIACSSEIILAYGRRTVFMRRERWV